MTEKLSQLFSELTGSGPCKVEQLRGSGSNRSYFRIAGCDGKTYIGVEGTSLKEDRAFCELARHFRKKGINVPEVLARTDDYSAYIQEDLGDLALFDIPDGPDKEELIFKTIRMLPKIQFEGADGLDWSLCFPQKEFDARMVSFDLNYFKYCFLKPSGIEFDEIALEDDFARLSAVLLENRSETFMYRDFQARNVMIKDEEPYLIDFQGGRKGPVYYDVASFVWQARAAYPDALKERLVDAYMESAEQYVPIDRAGFKATLRQFVLFRTLQVLGAYGFRGLIEKKEHFIRSIPFAIENLRRMFETGFTEYPALAVISGQLADRFRRSERKGDGTLEVKVSSFSFKKGVPADESGNGGGYVFDCRGFDNPGRYEEYRNLTGRDPEVIKFLENTSGVASFLDHVRGLVNSHIEEFIRRGFTHLEICFGCTGGQHRSVYCAEKTARHIIEKYNVKVRLVHREQGVDEYLK